MIIRKYRIVIYPYVYISTINGQYLLYNTINGAYISGFNLNILRVIKSIILIDNFYTSAAIQLCDKDINNFISELHNKYIGECFEDSHLNSSIQSYPILNIQRDIRRYKGHIDDNIVRYLQEISIYMNLKCDKQCKECNFAYKQYLFCFKNEKAIDLDTNQLISFLTLMKLPSLHRINILGGNIWNSPYLTKLANQLSLLSNVSIYFYSHIINFDIKYIDNLSENCFVIVQVYIDEDSASIEFYANDKVQYQFFVTNESHLIIITSIIERYGLNNYTIKPLYITGNKDFFKRNVYVEINDIFKSISSFQSICRNRTLNCNYFGKIIILPNGTIYSDINRTVIGNILHENISEIIKNELTLGHSWLRVRRKQIHCKSCIYRDICPPTSNLEEIMHKNDLCHIKRMQ